MKRLFLLMLIAGAVYLVVLMSKRRVKFEVEMEIEPPAEKEASVAKGD